MGVYLNTDPATNTMGLALCSFFQGVSLFKHTSISETGGCVIVGVKPLKLDSGPTQVG